MLILHFQKYNHRMRDMDNKQLDRAIAEVEIRDIKHRFGAQERRRIEKDEDDELNQVIVNHASYNALTAAYEGIFLDRLDTLMPLGGATLDPSKEDSISGADRSHPKQIKMRASMIESYNCKDETRAEKEGQYWCPIMGQYVQKVICAHIVPCAIGARAAAYMFGLPEKQGENFIMDAQNSIPMHPQIEQAFDQHLCTIVPTDDKLNYRFIVLDQSILKSPLSKIGDEPTKTFADLHGQVLDFKNAFRPRSRCLFWHFLFSIARRQTVGVAGFHLDRERASFRVGEEDFVFRNVWASPGGYLKRSVLGALAVRWGFNKGPGGLSKWMAECGLVDDDAEDDAELDIGITAAVQYTVVSREMKSDDDVFT